MKVFGFLLSLLLLFGFVLASPKQTYALGSTLCNMCPEACGGTSGVKVSSGEYFKCQLSTAPVGYDGGFKICKGSGGDCSYYEKFYWKGGKIYYVEDTTWAVGNGKDVMCNGTNEPAKLTRLDPSNRSEPMLWIDGNQTCTTSSQILQGVSKVSGLPCAAPFTNDGKPVSQTICKKDVGSCVKFPNGTVVNDPMVYTITEGPGASEDYYYYYDGKNGGWLGFKYPNSCTGNFAEVSPTPGATCTIEAGCSVVIPTQTRDASQDVCLASDMTPQTFRPRPCKNCDLNLPGSLMSNGYATTVRVSKTVRIWETDLRTGGDDPGAVVCDGKTYAYVNWGGILSLDTDNTTVPFAGYGGSDKLDADTNAQTQYLADYFDGTSQVRSYDPTIPEEQAKIYEESGVFRQLAPQELQDKYKRDFISRVQTQKGVLPPRSDGSVRQYYINATYAGKKFEASIKDFFDTSRQKPNKDDFKTDIEAYNNALKTWEAKDGGKWRALWANVPMVSREDAPGKVLPSIQGPPGSISRADGKPVVKMSFPNLPRLAEILNYVASYFKPFESKEGLIVNNSKIPSNTNNTAQTQLSQRQQNNTAGQVLGDLSACPIGITFQPDVTSNGGSNYSACWRFNGYDKTPTQDHGSFGYDFGYHVTVSVNGVPVGSSGVPVYAGRGVYEVGNTTGYGCNDGAKPIPFTAAPGSTVTMSITFDAGHFGAEDASEKPLDCKIPLASTVVCNIGADGKPDLSTCKATLPPKPIVCGNKFAYTPASVDPSGLRDNINGSKLNVVCTDPYPATFRVSVNQDQVLVPGPTCGDWQENNKGQRYIMCTVSRLVGVGVQIPYLNQIWSQISRIAQPKEPEIASMISLKSEEWDKISKSDIPAKAPIGFGFVADNVRGDLGESSGVSPNSGYLFYPKLASAACAKAYIQKYVWPKDVRDETIEKLWSDCKTQMKN